jgi:hypothetical protein
MSPPITSITNAENHVLVEQAAYNFVAFDSHIVVIYVSFADTIEFPFFKLLEMCIGKGP